MHLEFKQLGATTVLLFLLCHKLCVSQIRAQDIRFERVGMSEGLSFSGVRGIAQDDIGFLWISTSRGLNRYDGYTFKKYWHDQNDSTTLTDDRTYDLLVDSRGDLWLATNHGLNLYNRETDSFIRFQTQEDDSTSLSDNRVNTIFEDSEGWIWVGTVGGGLNRFDRDTETFKRYQHDSAIPESISSNFVSVVYEDVAGQLWIGTANGLNKFDRELETFSQVIHPIKNVEERGHNSIHALLEDKDGRFWVGTAGENGIHLLDRESGEFKEFIYDPTEPFALGQPPLQNDRILFSSLYRVNTILQDKNGYIWFGTLQGPVVRYDPDKMVMDSFEHDPTDPNSLGGNWPWQIFQDNGGQIWIVSDARGLSKVVESKFEQFQNKRTREGNNVLSIFEGRDQIWIGSLGGLSSIDTITKQINLVQIGGKPLISEPVYSVLEDRKGWVWVGTEKGVARVDPLVGEIRWYYETEGDSSRHSLGSVNAFHEDESGYVWIFSNSGVSRFNDFENKLERQVMPDEFDGESKNIRAISKYGVNDLWLISRTRMYPFYPDTGQWGAPVPILPFTTLANEDELGRLWIGNGPVGLQLMEKRGEPAKQFRVDERTVAGNLLGMIEDEEGVFWISDYSGLTRFDPLGQTVKRFNEKDGIPHVGYNPRSYHKGKSGRFYFGGTQGLTSFKPDVLNNLTEPPAIAFTDFLVDNKPLLADDGSLVKWNVSASESVYLRYDQNDFKISFAAFDFRNPQNNLYKYKLEGYDSEWQGPTTTNHTIYSKIKPGNYEFKVLAANSDGVWNEKGITLNVYVDSPWWNSKSAYAGYAICLFGLLVFANGLQRKNLKRNERRKAEKEQIRLKVNAAEERTQYLEEYNQAQARFFAYMSHEFRTPLMLISGPIDDVLAGRAGELNEEQRSHFHVMKRNAFRLEHLTNQILDLSRAEAGQMPLRLQHKDIVSFIRHQVHLFLPLAHQKQLSLEFNCPSEPLMVYFDAEKLEMICMNLISNACKFTPMQGRVQVSVKRELEDVVIRVEDSGVGIPEEMVASIFERFLQADNAFAIRHQGSGLGLALVKELVNLHGGKVTVSNLRDSGAVFLVKLPLGKNHFQKEDIANETPKFKSRIQYDNRFVDPVLIFEEKGSGSNTNGSKRVHAYTILVIEDNSDVRNYLRQHLSGSYNLVEAANGLDGLTKAQEMVPDLIISDIMMPEMDGLTLCDKIKSNEDLNHIPVILLTALAGEVEKLEGLERGADDYLFKPFNADELLIRVENLIEIRRLLRSKFSNEFYLVDDHLVLSSEEAGFVEQVRIVIEHEISNSNLTMEQVADAVGLSLRQLHRRLKEMVGLTPAGYVRSMRLENASVLLKNSDKNISEIARLVGFKDPDYFSRLFKQVYGVSATQYRNQ